MRKIIGSLFRSLDERRSRSIIYRADLDRLRAVAFFLLKDCCGGPPEVCVPLLGELRSPRQTKETTRA